MAGLVLSGLTTIKPFSQSLAIPTKNPSKITFLPSKNPIFSTKTKNPDEISKWVIKVSAPLKIHHDLVPEKPNLDEESVKENEEFDAGVPPPFKLAEIRASIPKHCWVKDSWKSMSYVVRDVAIVFGLAAFAGFVNNWFVWPLYWAAQGTMFWALFVLGHDW